MSHEGGASNKDSSVYMMNSGVQSRAMGGVISMGAKRSKPFSANQNTKMKAMPDAHGYFN